jgi:hypothetical protein
MIHFLILLYLLLLLNAEPKIHMILVIPVAANRVDSLVLLLLFLILQMYDSVTLRVLK